MAAIRLGEGARLPSQAPPTAASHAERPPLHDGALPLLLCNFLQWWRWKKRRRSSTAAAAADSWRHTMHDGGVDEASRRCGQQMGEHIHDADTRRSAGAVGLPADQGSAQTYPAAAPIR